VNDNEGPTYVCKDCGAQVYDTLGIKRERCLTCAWINDAPEKDRARLREFLRVDRDDQCR
jgi:hypothetical protein